MQIYVHRCFAHTVLTIITALYGNQILAQFTSFILFYLFRKCIRKIWNVPYRTHCVILKYLYASCGIEADLLSRFISFYDKSITSQNQCIRFCGKFCQHSRTPVSANIRTFLHRLNNDGTIFEVKQPLSYVKQLLYQSFHCDTHCKSKGDTIRYLCLIRDDLLSSGLGINETNTLIYQLCIK